MDALPLQTGHSFTNFTTSDGARAHYGDIINIRTASTQQNKSPTPVSTVPFPRDSDYVRRENVIQDIGEKVSVPTARVALVGLGGVGKTQIAIDYAYQIRDESPDTWVFWLHASSAPRFDSSVRDVVAQLQIPGYKDPGANVYQLFRSWLRDPESGSWVLVLDNADDVRFLLQPPASERADNQDPRPSSGDRCLDYLPPSSHGKLLFTTRSLSAALEITDRSNVVMVEPMEESHALLLLQRKLQGAYDQDHGAELAKQLDFMPLAMTQAAAYISKQARRSSISDYVQKLRKNSKSTMRLLARNDGDTRRDREATNSILLTWQISFNYIQEQRTSAADLLSLMSCFDRQSIPEALLNDMSKEWGKAAAELPVPDTQSTGGVDSASLTGSVSSTSCESENEEFTEDIQTLLDYAFIAMTGGETSFEMHRLVQLATQSWLESQKTLENYQSHFISSLDNAFPEYAVFEDWRHCQTLLPHAVKAVAIRPSQQNVIMQQASLLRKLGWYGLKQGNLAVAETSCSRSLTLSMDLHGPKHPDTAEIMSILAATYLRRCLYEHAVSFGTQALQTRKELFGLEHPDTAKSMNILAAIYLEQDSYQKAIELGTQTLDIRKKLFGLEHPDTAMSMSNLAAAYLELDHFEKAVELGTQTLEIRKKLFGLHHPDTSMSLNNLAAAFFREGLYEQAIELGTQALSVRKDLLGPDHPDTSMSIHNLAAAYHKQGLYEKAVEFGVQAVQIREKLFGPEHPDTATSVKTLALAYYEQGLYDQAAELHAQALSASEKAFGLTHPKTVIATFNMALSLYSIGNDAEATEQLQCAAIRSGTAFGKDHSTTLRIRKQLEHRVKRRR